MTVPPVEVYGSTMRDHVHKGPNQAGNKSLLTYRPDLGVPGYTGYISSTGSIVLPVKPMDHTGRPATSAANAALVTKTTDTKKHTEYLSQYNLSPGQTFEHTKTGGGYWISDRKLPDNVPFIGKTVYQTEVLEGPFNTSRQLERVDGLVSTLAVYEAARKANDMRRSQSVDPSSFRSRAGASAVGSPGPIPPSAGMASNIASSTLLAAAGKHGSAAAAAAFSRSLERPATTPTNYGELPGYQTTYGSMMDAGARILESTQATSSSQPGTSAVGGGDPRFATLPRVMVPTMDGAYSTYAADFGADASDPMERQTASKMTMTRNSTTKGLADGTTRNCSHIPRYTGHIPASRYNTPIAHEHGSGAAPRPDHKAGSLLFGLDQYSRTRVPGVTTYKPQAARNMTSIQPSQGPTAATTSGDATFRGTRFGVPPGDHSHYINSRAGLMTFFNNSNTGTEFVSENGLFNAQVFYKLARPGEGALRMQQPPGTTYYGAQFNAAASMV